MIRRDEDPKFVCGNDGLEPEPELREAIGLFKSNLDSWSDNALGRPRKVVAPASINRGCMAKWALGCAVFVGTVSGGVYEGYRQQSRATADAARLAGEQRELAAQRASEEADLMAKVDSDIARQVPSALEPLASLMDENQGTGN